MLTKINFYRKYPKRLIQNLSFSLRSFFIKESYDLIIIDDVFPNKLSAWRYEEFTSYLSHFKDRLCIFSTGHSLGALRDTKSISSNITQFKKENPDYKGQIKKFQHHRKVKAKLGYVLFLDNATAFLSYFEANSIPFIVTLYPGAGFFLNQKKTDEALKIVTSSPFFRGIITTQNISTEYLLKKNFCNPSQIKFIFGVVTPRLFLNSTKQEKKFFSNGCLNVAFIANKQMPKGIDKGYDVFIETANLLVQKNKNIVFHVVGPFDENDIELQKIKGQIVFHGFIETKDFPKFYESIDLIISPNRPFILKPGAFDGFPTGACSEAGLNQVALMITDPLNLNFIFKDGEDFILIVPDPVMIANKISYYLENPHKLELIARNGQKVLSKFYSIENQILKRIDFLEKNITNGTND